MFDRHAGYELQWNAIRRVFMTSLQQRGRLTETPDETAARLSAQRDRDRQRRNSVDYFEVALTMTSTAHRETSPDYFVFF